MQVKQEREQARRACGAPAAALPAGAATSKQADTSLSKPRPAQLGSPARHPRQTRKWMGKSDARRGRSGSALRTGPRCSVTTSSSQKRARLFEKPARPSSSSETAGQRGEGAGRRVVLRALPSARQALREGAGRPGQRTPRGSRLGGHAGQRASPAACDADARPTSAERRGWHPVMHHGQLGWAASLGCQPLGGALTGCTACAPAPIRLAARRPQRPRKVRPPSSSPAGRQLMALMMRPAGGGGMGRMGRSVWHAADACQQSSQRRGIRVWNASQQSPAWPGSAAEAPNRLALRRRSHGP